MNNLIIDNNIISYFTDNEIDINNFLLKYIEIDKYLKKSINNEDNNIISDNINKLISTCNNFEDKLSYIKHLCEKSPVIDDNIINKIELLLLKNDNNNNSNINDKLEKYLENIDINISNNSKIINDINNIFTNNSCKKGEMGENMIETLLNKEFSDYEILNMSKEPHKGDFHIIKSNKPKILLELKNYSLNVPKREIIKFIDDIKTNNMSGILVSLNSGISTKSNFSFEIINKNIIIYIHNFNFDIDKIKLAINIIYTLHNTIKNKTDDICISLNDEEFKILHDEYMEFIQNFDKNIKNIKNSIDLLNNCKMTLLDNFFNKSFKIKDTKKITCSICGKKYANKSSYTKHYKIH